MSHPRTTVVHRRRPKTGLPLCALTLIGCSGGLFPADPGERVVEVEVVPVSHTLHSFGQRTSVTARAIASTGGVIQSPAALWASSDQSTLRIDDTGSVTALRNGSALVSATVQGVTGAARVVVEQVVAEVRGYPRVHPLVLGNTLPLLALPLDSLGSPLEGAGLQWSVSDSAIARVSSLGVVSARSLGSTTVLATSAGVSGSQRIDVVPAAWPHEPDGLEPITSNPWDSSSSPGWVHLDRESESRIVSDPTAPSSPPLVLEHVFPSGFGSAGLEPAVDWYHVGGRRELFAGVWWKASDGWQGHESGINKLLFIWSRSHQSNVVFTVRGPPGGPYYLEAVAQRQPDSRKDYLPQNEGRSPVVPGQWHRLEIHLVADPLGAGTIRWWQDGELLGEYLDFRFVSGGWGEFQIAPTWGGVGGPPKLRTDYIRVDEVYLSGR